jgi:hypothetical protein
VTINLGKLELFERNKKIVPLFSLNMFYVNVGDMYYEKGGINVFLVDVQCRVAKW